MGGDPLHVSLRDEELNEEIQLLTDLIVAAGETTDRMCPVEIDRIIGAR